MLLFWGAYPGLVALLLDDPPMKDPLLSKRKADQKAVDAAVLKAVKAVPMLKQYLNAKFSLKQGQFPHMMKF